MLCIPGYICIPVIGDLPSAGAITSGMHSGGVDQLDPVFTKNLNLQTEVTLFRQCGRLIPLYHDGQVSQFTEWNLQGGLGAQGTEIGHQELPILKRAELHKRILDLQCNSQGTITPFFSKLIADSSKKDFCRDPDWGGLGQSQV